MVLPLVRFPLMSSRIALCISLVFSIRGSVNLQRKVARPLFATLSRLQRLRRLIVSENKFFSAYDVPPGKACPSGSMHKKERQARLREDGLTELVVTGEMNLHEYINSFKDECDVEKIVARCAISGDYTALQCRQGIFGDFTNIPNHPTALDAAIRRDQSFFESLPVDVRSRYKSFADFSASLVDEVGVNNFIAYMTNKEVTA